MSPASGGFRRRTIVGLRRVSAATRSTNTLFGSSGEAIDIGGGRRFDAPLQVRRRKRIRVAQLCEMIYRAGFRAEWFHSAPGDSQNYRTDLPISRSARQITLPKTEREEV